VRLAFLAGTLAIAVSARSSAAQDDRLGAKLDPTTRATVLQTLEAARASGLPTDPLIDKALEGGSKGAPGPRIVYALQTLMGELATARQTLGDASEPEIAAAAGALHIGVRPTELARLQLVRGRQPLTVALGVLSDLVARGVPTDTATMAVTVLVDARVADDELVDFRRNVERDISLGAPPAAAAAGRLTSDRFGLERNGPASLGGSTAPPPRPPRRPRRRASTSEAPRVASSVAKAPTPARRSSERRVVSPEANEAVNRSNWVPSTSSLLASRPPAHPGRIPGRSVSRIIPAPRGARVGCEGPPPLFGGRTHEQRSGTCTGR
jgi:hypothetical protein